MKLVNSIEDDIVRKIKEAEPIMINSEMGYKCDCGYNVIFRVDDRLLNQANWQPVPFSVCCPKCDGNLRHIDRDKDKKFKSRPLNDNESYFKFDFSNHPYACGIPCIKTGKK